MVGARLTVALGLGATVTAGDTVAVLAPVRSAGNMSLAALPVVAAVGPPRRLVVPTLSVEGPADVGPCEVAQLIAHSAFPR